MNRLISQVARSRANENKRISPKDLFFGDLKDFKDDDELKRDFAKRPQFYLDEINNFSVKQLNKLAKKLEPGFKPKRGRISKASLSIMKRKLKNVFLNIGAQVIRENRPPRVSRLPQVIKFFDSGSREEHNRFGTTLLTLNGSVSFPATMKSEIRMRAMKADITTMIDRFINLNRRDFAPTDDIFIRISHPNLYRNDNAKYRRILSNDLNATQVLEMLEDVLKYPEIVNSMNELTVKLTVVRPPQGSGGRNYQLLHTDRNSIHRVYNKDHHCFWYALAVALSDLKQKGKLQTGFSFEGKEFRDELLAYHRIKNSSRKGYAKKFYKQVFRLRELCGFASHDLPISYNEYSKISVALCHLLNVQLAVYHNGRWIFPDIEETRCEEGLTVMLLLEDEHYDTIIKPNKLGNYENFCYYCMKGYSFRHRCDGIHQCKICGSKDCKGETSSPKVFCNQCNLFYRNQECYDFHKVAKDRMLCENRISCLKCHYKIGKRPLEEHVCGYSECVNCKEYCDVGIHKCYMKTQFKLDKKKARRRFIYYDFECDVSSDITKRHLPVCVHYTFVDEEEKFEEAGVISGDDITRRFVKEVLLNRKYKGSTAIAHNSGKYDIHFIRHALIKLGIECKIFIKNGGRILYMELSEKKNGIRFIDSFTFIPNKLKDFPKMFDLQANIVKGEFPYLLLTKDGYDNDERLPIGEFPDYKYFDILSKQADLSKATDDYRECYAFVQEQKELYRKNRLQYCIREETDRYCKMDVEILRKGMERFRDIYVNELGFHDPVLHHFTMPQFAYKVLLSMVPENSIAVFKDDLDVNRSKCEDEYIGYIATNKIIVRQAKVGKYFVDGLDRGNKTVYEFLGCHFHGCRTCHPTKRYISQNHLSKSYDQVYNDWVRKKRYLEQLGYSVVEMWEHQWNELKQGKLKDMNFEISRTFRLRDALYGGRCSVMKARKERDDDGYICFVDISSSYPAQMKGRIRGCRKDDYDIIKELFFPVGHHKTLEYNISSGLSMDEFVNDVFGVVQCSVRVPSEEELGITILPYREDDGSLNWDTFGKTLEGSWPSEELKYALARGYKLEWVGKAFHWEEKSSTLFREYMEKFYEMRKQKKAEKNNAMASCLKILLNCTWGKFSQGAKTQKEQIIYSKKPEGFYDLLSKDRANEVKIESIDFDKDDDFVIVDYKVPEYETNNIFKTNPVYGLFTTAYARMRLYDGFEAVGKENVLYCDTDSIVYTDTKECELYCPPEEDRGAGDWEMEYSKGLEFVSYGAKTYDFEYENKDGDVCYKRRLKGFGLSVGKMDKLIKDLCPVDYESEAYDELFEEEGVLAMGELRRNNEKYLQVSLRIKNGGSATIREMRFEKDRVGNVRTVYIDKQLKSTLEKNSK